MRAFTPAAIGEMRSFLRGDGFVDAPAEPLLAADLVAALYDAPSYTGHVIPQGDRIRRDFAGAMAQQHGHVCHPMASILAVPNLFEIIAQYHSLAEAYFGEEPMLYSVNAFWKKAAGPSGQHTDSDDGPKQMVMFMYGTDVPDDAHGIHTYVTGSHEWPREALRKYHNVQIDVSGPLPPEWPVRTFYGPAGTTFITDTRGMHNGYPPLNKPPRLLLWARWCGQDGPPAAYHNDETKPARWETLGIEKPSALIQKRTRLVVDWSERLGWLPIETAPSDIPLVCTAERWARPVIFDNLKAVPTGVPEAPTHWHRLDTFLP